MRIKEKSVISACQAGKLEEFGWIYENYAKKIYNFTYYKTYNRETAEDLTSQIFFKALSKINKFDNNGSFSGWLYTIARNTIIDYYRSNHFESDIDDFWGLEDKTRIEHDLDIKTDLEKVKTYMTRLDVGQREIIMLRVWEEMSYKEISKITGKSEENCRMIFSRTIAKIRKESLITLFTILFLS